MLSWLLSRANAYADTIQHNLNERLDAWIDIFKKNEKIHEQEMQLLREKLDLYDEKIKVYEGRIERLDRWMQNVALGIGVGAPSPTDDTEYPEPSFDPMADSSFSGLFGAYQQEYESPDEDLIDKVMSDGE